MNKDIQQLLPSYVNGTLAGPDRDRIEDALAADQEGARHVAWERSVQKAVKADPLYEVAADRGLFQVMQRIKMDSNVAAAVKPAARKPGAVAQLPQAGAGWASRLRDRIRWSPALALACTVVAVQFGVIAQMISTRSDEIAYAEYRAIESQSRGDTFIRVIFKPVTTEAQLTQILRANSAEIVAGPSQLGEYHLLVPPKEATPTLSRMLANVQIESAEIVNALPTHP